MIFFFGGGLARNVDWGRAEVMSVKESVELELRASLSKLVINRLEGWYGTGSDCWDERGDWEGCNGKKADTEASERAGLGITESFIVQLLSELTTVTGRSNPSLFHKALFYRRGHGRRAPRYQHHILRVGDAVDVIVDTTQSSDLVL